MQRLPGVARHHQAYLLAYPFAFERLNLAGHDLVISSSSAWAKAVCPPPGVPHLCYCHAPMRFAWNLPGYIQGEPIHPLARVILPPVMAALRRWDVRTAKRVTRFIANSSAVADRIQRCYGRDSVVIHPPVATDRFQPASDTEDWFLVVQRLVPYKRLDLVIEAFNALRLPLRIVGDGRARADLERLAGPTITFTGRLSDVELAHAFARCRAYIVPGEEDFAIAPVEAQAAGRPVIALAAGGVLDTVVEGQTGLFFHEQTPAALIEAARFEQRHFDPALFDPRPNLRYGRLRAAHSRPVAERCWGWAPHP
jgi:glycosyltransferase involved in cell wall biosynthesis